MAFKKEVLDKLISIEEKAHGIAMKVHEQTIQLSVNNKILDEHHKRSTHLEERIKPIEDSQIFFNKLAKALIACMGVLASAAAIYHYLVK